MNSYPDGGFARWLNCGWDPTAEKAGKWSTYNTFIVLCVERFVLGMSEITFFVSIIFT
jgi:hypothetical protein